MEPEQDKSKKKDSQKVVKIPDEGVMQVRGSSPQEQGVESANKVMEKFIKKSED